MATDLWAAYRRMDAALAKHGFAPTGRFWRTEIERFYTHESATNWIGCIGRGGAKSTHSVKTAVCEVLFGDFQIPPGERHYFIFVSETVQEAQARLRLIEAYLTALGVAFERTGDVVDLVGQPRGFRVLACRIGAVSGVRSIGCALDEVAKWSHDGANPAEEIAISLRATGITHPSARTRIFSSPMGKVGFHFERVMAGDDAHQIVSHAASWVANPDAITEAMARKLEPDPRIFAREYQAVPQDAVCSALDADLVRKAVRDPGRCAPLGPPVLVIDSSAGRGDAWTWAVAQWMQPHYDEQDAFVWDDIVDANGKIIAERVNLRVDRDGNPVRREGFAIPKPLLYVSSIGAFEGQFSSVMTSDAVLDSLVRVGKRAQVHRVIGDQYQSYFLTTAFAKARLPYVSQTWTNDSKIDAVSRLRQWLREGVLVIEPGPEGEKMARELLTLEERVSRAGALTFGGRRASKDDRAALILNLAMCDAEGGLRGGPFARRFGKVALGPGDFSNP